MPIASAKNSIMLGIGFYLLNRLFASLGVINDWSPLASAALPTMLFLALAIGMMMRVDRC